MDDIPFFLSRRGFSPEKDAWLDFREKDGLYIIWTFAKNENYNSASDDRPIYESLVSPFVVSMSYVYIDDDGRWLEEEDMDYVSSSSVASNQMPTFIKLVFERGKETHTRYISLLSNVDGEFAPGGSSAASSRNNSSNGGGNSSSGGEGGNGGGNVNRPSGARPGGGANGGAPSGGGSGGAK